MEEFVYLTEKLYQDTVLSKEEYVRLVSLAMEQGKDLFLQGEMAGSGLAADRQEEAAVFGKDSCKLQEEAAVSEKDSCKLQEEAAVLGQGLCKSQKEAGCHLEGLLFERARSVRERIYGKDVYIRGLIEFTNYCRNNCYYCGIRRDNRQLERYRLTTQEILACAEEGYALGFRTIVLQGGEDFSYRTEEIGELVAELKRRHSDCAVTLSMGEREREVYQYWYTCGADRYLLRHETATKEHYERLHPPEMSFAHRIQCLYDLKEIGYQVGAGFMVGSPWQTIEHLAGDLLFLKELSPHMVGIGPFIAQKDSPFAEQADGTLYQTLVLLAIIRLTLPNVLLPSTTALRTIHPQGRELGILAGANVVMPNLSPVSVREKYALYDGKLCMGEESAQALDALRGRIEAAGYQVVPGRGDYRANTLSAC